LLLELATRPETNAATEQGLNKVAIRRSTVALLLGVGTFSLTLSLLGVYQRKASATTVQAEAGMRDVRLADLDSPITASNVHDIPVPARDPESGPTRVPESNPGNDSLREYADRTPRLNLRNCSGDIEAYSEIAKTFCDFYRRLSTEQIDPNWSSATEKRIRELWIENVPDLSDELLFVMCKTTACQVNYRFPVEMLKLETPDHRLGGSYFDAFLDGFQRSTLASELRRFTVGYDGPVISVGFERIRPQDDR
jgi:hypothetical protein